MAYKRKRIHVVAAPLSSKKMFIAFEEIIESEIAHSIKIESRVNELRDFL